MTDAERIVEPSRRARGTAPLLLERVVRHRGLLFWAAVVILSAVLFGHWYGRYVVHALRPGWYTDDVRTVMFAFFRFEEPEAYRNDLLSRYALAINPPFHRVVFTVFGWLGLVRPATQVAPLLLFVVTLAGVAATARRLGGLGAGLLAVVLMTGSSLYLERMSGALPRAFAFPFVAWALYAAVTARFRLFSVLVVLCAGFYPSAGLLLGVGFTGVMMLNFSSDRIADGFQTLASRVRWLLLTAALGAVVLLPMIVSAAQWGERVGGDEHDLFPEAGPGGTQGTGDRPPWLSAVQVAYQTFQATFFSTRRFWPGPERLLGDFVLQDLVLLLIVLGAAHRLSRDASSRRLGAVLLGVFVTHILARAFYPAFFSPTRAIQYGLPLVMVIAASVAAADLGRGWADRFRPRWRGWAPIVSAGLVGLMIGSKASSRAGFVFRLSEPDLAMYRAIDRLEPGVVIAGWPDDPMSHVSWLTHRQAFMTGEMHLPFHKGYLLAVRDRLNAFFTAYHAVDEAALVNFRDKHGVTHVLVDRHHFRTDPPLYMEPFRPKLAELRRKARRRYVIPKLASKAVWRGGRFFLLDLRKL